MDNSYAGMVQGSPRGFNDAVKEEAVGETVNRRLTRNEQEKQAMFDQMHVLQKEKEDLYRQLEEIRKMVNSDIPQVGR